MTGNGAGGGLEGAREDLVGASVDAFEIVELLGRGGMGEVFRGRDTRLDRPVALKVLRPLYAGDKDLVDRFEREARAASAVSHPNVAQIYWTGRIHGRPYYAMEYIEGETLAVVLRREGRITGRKSLAYLEQACEGLRAALAKGVIHRDIKPGNVMIDQDGNAKIVDFGLARRLSEDETLTRGDCVLGTPRYISPEQALAQPVDHRADIYSLGATFYHLLAGTPPFDADTPVAVMMRHVHDPVPPLKERSPSVPGAVCAIIERMLAKLPEDRYQSYDELLADIALVKRGGSPRGVGEATHRVVPRVAAAPAAAPASPAITRFLVGAALAATVAVILFAVGSSVLSRRASSGEEAGEEPAVEVPTPDARRGDPGQPRLDWSSPQAPEVAPEVTPADDEQEPAPTPEEPRPTATMDGLITLALKSKTLAAMRQLATALQAHMAEHDELPASLEEVAARFELLPEDLLDGWGRRIHYVRTSPRHFRLTSAGADGVLANDDDIVMENGRIVQGEPEILPPTRR